MSTTTSKDLGLVAGMIPGTIPPTNTSILWLDTSQTPAVKKYFDTTDNTWKPLLQIGNNNANNSISIDLGEYIIFVSQKGNDYKGAKGDLSKCFNTISGAYNYAKTLTPSLTKKIVIAVYPSVYIESFVMDTDYISIVSAVPQNLIYNADLINGVTFDNMKRRYVVEGTIEVKANNASIKGIDVRNLILKSYFPVLNEVKPNISLQNMMCQNITNSTTIGTVNGYFFDVHAENFLNSDTQTSLSGTFIMSGGTKAFRSGLATFSNNTWKGGIKDSTFDTCYGGDGSFGGLGGYIYNSTFTNCVMKNNCIGTIEQSQLTSIKMGNDCIKALINTKLQAIQGGTNCIKDFTDIVIQDGDFGAGLGKGGVKTFVSGNFDNVKSDYTDGFADGRPFWGKMRRMFVRTTNAVKPCLNVFTPNDAGVDRQPTSLEHSTFLHCGSGKTVIGTAAFISYCKFNLAYELLNVLGSDVQSDNIINFSLCNYSPISCVTPSLFELTVSSFTTGTPITFNFNCQLPVSRAGAQIEMTKPNGTVSYKLFVGNNNGAGSVSLSITELLTMAGAYKFRLRTICQLDGLNNPSFSSSWTSTITANVTTASRPVAWKASDPTVYCVNQQLVPQPLFAKLTMVNPTAFDDYYPDQATAESRSAGSKAQFRLDFFTDAGLTIPATLTNQTIKVFIKSRATAQQYMYTEGSGSPYSIGNNIFESVGTYVISNVNGSGVTLVDEVTTRAESYSRVSDTISQLKTDNITDYTFTLFPDNTLQGGTTGEKSWTTLEQYYTDNNQLTGTTKPNVITDTDYVAPVADHNACPVDIPVSRVGFGMSLNAYKVELSAGGTTVSPAIPNNPFDSQQGGQMFVVPMKKGVPTTVVARVDSYYTGGVTTVGKIQVTITHSGGSQNIQINKGQETTIGTFIDITYINFSNF